MNTTNATAALTDGMIRALRSEAADAGDVEQVRLCDLALEQYQPAREDCADAITYARAAAWAPGDAPVVRVVP